jgi:glycyl-tRNA synthetase
MTKENTMDTYQLESLKPIVALCKRRGFVFQGSEIYGGFANTYSYGPYGAELKKNIKDLWWKRFVRNRQDVLGLDGPIFLHPKTWEASGHVAGFSDALIDCKGCKGRFRVDHLIEEQTGEDAEGISLEKMNEIISENEIICPTCKAKDFTAARSFNLMFSTKISKTSDSSDPSDSNTSDAIYLRPETAQAIFLDYKNVLDSTRAKPPFGLAQIGKAFRNEITPGNFIFRLIEFEQMEIEYFIAEDTWEEKFALWQKDMLSWAKEIGLSDKNISLHEHPQEKLSHYSKKTVDVMYHYPFGVSELYGLAYRTDFDLSQHAKSSGAKLEYLDLENKTRWIPHVIEPTFGVDRSILAILCEAYEEEKLENGETRVVLHFKPNIAPVKVAVFPLMKKEGLLNLSKEIFEKLQNIWACEYDISGSIGKRYRRQDELGTPCCVTIDYESLDDQAVTVRDRDTMEQKRIKIDDLLNFLQGKLSV